ncbi:hypothetical protein BCR37DRAFT_377542 [Protomyces lactucae-debilis]|uniref:Uncharacterized protein n=1 Tax=Protomyces lactucae-debilis TaxID=2754530 RepID=A0A1Y2FLA4_PROLT|nr:uncharacterized protein BCR37DRAFT_377542 [Protomyces lactucae-debilis]ORY84781.1 hypothetical protein BCR37DRAFT_377542 [Protomyces lactucae-debilis]
MLALKSILLLTSCALLSVYAAKPLSYCKCTCGKSSAIVPLTEDVLATPAKPCTDCTRIFCLTKSGLASCPSVDDTESDIVVTQSCFQRESRKDEGIVIGFILIT